MSKALRLSELRTRLDKLEKGGAGNPFKDASDSDLLDLAEAMLADPGEVADFESQPDGPELLDTIRKMLAGWQRGADGAWARVPDLSMT